MTKTKKRLPDLLKESGITVEGKIPDLIIRRVTDDSRNVRPGTLFVAVKGTKEDGHRFLEEAIRRGATAVLTEEPCAAAASCVQIQVPATRPMLGPLMHTFLGEPSRQMNLVGVTGTNGKTTVAWLIQHLLNAAQIPCGLIGTVSIRDGRSEHPSGNTTPGAVALQEWLSRMRDHQLKACAMEVSSHALQQHRTQGIHWASAVFTNASPEHLDYHDGFENYLKAKLRLFEDLEASAAAVINRDDPVWERFQKACRSRIIRYSLRGPADLTAENLELSMEGIRANLVTPEGKFQIASPLVGRHNLENILAALGATLSLGCSLREILTALSSFSGVPGRLERIEAGQPFPVFVDYAHTDGALQPVLENLRAVSRRRILLVFGCGGNRDQTKRRRMGQVAGRLADRVVVTSDNPRFEDPEAIAQQVAEGLQGASIPWEIILDRREAIRTALEAATPEWLVLIAGKGHESVQIFGNQTVSFDDRAVVRELLSGERVCK